MFKLRKARRFGSKKPEIPDNSVARFGIAAPNHGKLETAAREGVFWTRFQKAFILSSLSSRRLPAIRLALMAPIDVPMTQSGSTPAS